MTLPPSVLPWPCCCLWQRGPCVSCGSSLPGGSAQRCCWRWLYWWPLGCHELARLARQRAEWQGFAGVVRKACPGLARVDAAGMARTGRNGQAGRAWQARCGAARSGQAMQAWRGTMMRDPVRLGKARQAATTGQDWNGWARQAWLRKARPGQFWQARRGQAWKVRHGWLGEMGDAERGKARHGWLGVVGLGQGTAGKASWAPLAGHGRRGNKGMAGSGVAGCCRHR